MAPAPAAARPPWGTGPGRLLSPLALLLPLLLSAPARAREADERSRFLYADEDAGDPSAARILEYQLHNAPSRDYSGDERRRAAREQPGSEYDEERHIRPYFLSADNGPRVVQYYSPWSGHCQFFKTKYISLAKEIEARLPEDQPVVSFHAVSCSVYHWICMQNQVKSFPTIVAYEATSAIPNALEEKDLTAETIAEALGVQLNAPGSIEVSEEGKPDEDGQALTVDILGATLNGLTRTREAVYRDAALSFTHALKTGIFPRDGDGQVIEGPLDDARREAFVDWIDLLYWSLPPTWILHTLIHDLRNNIDSVMFSEENLLSMVEKHQDVVNGANIRWSRQCSMSDDRAGYSCGLWSLFHIVSIGVMERHRAVLGARDQVSTKFVARTLRNYIENFFDCGPCREYFTEMFDTCGFNHCRRFAQPQKLPPLESWNEFALWLWEVHNDVNEQVTKAELQKEDGDWANSGRIMELAVWPPTRTCPACRDERGGWDTGEVLAHLKKEYWPSGVQNFRFIVLKRKDNSKVEDPGFLSAILSAIFDNVFFVALAITSVMWYSKKRYISFTGRHKKMDRDYRV